MVKVDWESMMIFENFALFFDQIWVVLEAWSAERRLYVAGEVALR